MAWSAYTGNLLTNPGAESNSMTGWSQVGGTNMQATDAWDTHSGTYAFAAVTNSSATNWMYQDYDLTADFTTAQLDGGKVRIQAGGWGRRYEAGYDNYRFKVEFLDSGLSVVSTPLDTDWQINTSWTNHEVVDSVVPATARYVRISGSCHEVDDYNAGTIDDFYLYTSYQTAETEQSGFRWRDDDGSEAGATWLEGEDTNTTQPLDTNIRLRVQVDTVGDLESVAPTLYHKLSTDGTYTAVPTSASYKAAPIIEVGDVTESGDNLTTPTSPWPVSRPTLAAGDMLILVIGWDDSATNTGVSVANGPNGEVWQQINSVVASNGTEVRMTAYHVVATGAWGAGSIDVTPSANEQWTAAVIKVPAGEFDATTPIGASNTLASASASETAVNCPSLSCGATDGSGRLIFAATVDADPQSALTAGWTALSNVDRGQESLSVNIRDTAVTNSESIAAGDASTTIASDSWCSLIFVVRAPTVTPPVYVAASSNITAGGEATTAQLTAPTGKSGNFTTGRLWDDENGSDAIDVTADYYTELEWCLRAQSPAENGDIYQFRVYAGSSPLDTYTLTPEWTIGSGAGGGESLAPIIKSIKRQRAAYLRM